MKKVHIVQKQRNLHKNWQVWGSSLGLTLPYFNGGGGGGGVQFIMGFNVSNQSVWALPRSSASRM